MPIDERPFPIVARIEGVSAGAIILILFACLIAGLGLLFLSQATSGVGAISIAVLLAIFARIAQAGAHHTAVMQSMRPR